MDKKKNRDLLTKYNDVYSATELELHVDGGFAGNAPKSKNNKCVKETITLARDKKARLAEVTVKTTRNKNRWGSAVRGWK